MPQPTQPPELDAVTTALIVAEMDERIARADARKAKAQATKDKRKKKD